MNDINTSAAMKLQIETVSKIQDFDTLREEWNRLLSSSRRTSAFLTWEWMSTWWHFYCEKDDSRSLKLMTVRNDAGQLIGALPGYVRAVRGASGRALHALTLMGSEFESSEYLDIVALPEFETQAADAILDALADAGSGVDLLQVRDLKASSLLMTAARAFAETHGLPHRCYLWKVCPHLPINGSFENFVSGLSKNMRYNLGRRTRKLYKEFDTEFEVVTSGDLVDARMNQLYELHDKRWETREGTSKFQDSNRHLFHSKVASIMAEADMLRLFSLRVDSKTVAVLYCFDYGNRIYYYQAGFDPDWSKFSVGLVLMGKCIEYAHEQGKTEFDFLRGGEAYKSNWTKESRETFELQLGLTPKGRGAVRLNGLYRRVKKNTKAVLTKAVPALVAD